MIAGTSIYMRKYVDGKKRTKTYTVIRKLGEGAQGKVYLASYKGNKVAIKIVVSKSAKERRKIKLEIDILKKISVECSIYLSCYLDSGTDISTGNIIIETEYINGQNLYEYTELLRYNMSSRKGQKDSSEETSEESEKKSDESEETSTESEETSTESKEEPKDILIELIFRVVKAITMALQIIHKYGILHNDIKPENIMVETDTRIPKLVDFGFACETVNQDNPICILDDEVIDKCCSGQGRNLANVAPEYIIYGIRYPQSDIWSLGSSMYILITDDIIWRKFPFERFSIPELKARIRRGQPERLKTENKKLNDLINGMTEKDIRKRLTSDLVLEMF